MAGKLAKKSSILDNVPKETWVCFDMLTLRYPLSV